VSKNPGKRKRHQVGRSAARPDRSGRAGHGEDDGPRREKLLRGRSNEETVPDAPSRRELEGDVRRGRVVALRGREAVVAPDGGGPEATCLLRKSTRVPHSGENALVVGDRVSFLAEGAPPFVLTEVEERRTALTRTRHGRDAQVIAANVDLCVIVASAAEPPFKPRLVDRFLISARAGGVEPALVLNKADLADPAGVRAMLAPYARLGLPALAVSAETGEGLDALRDLLRGRTSVFSGQSGVGKSTLLNRLDPELSLRTGEVYGRAGKGRHTTSASTLVAFPFGGAVIDTPGIRSFQLAEPTVEALDAFFPEIAAAAAECRFADCRHAGDAGCAIPAAVAGGDVDEDRLDSYRTLREEIERGG
jgi:ribosome biogenesis GTPase